MIVQETARYTDSQLQHMTKAKLIDHIHDLYEHMPQDHDVINELSDENDTLDKTVDRLQADIKKLKHDLDEYKGGYLYCVQYENDAGNHVFKLGMTGTNTNFTGRMYRYKSDKKKENHGEVRIMGLYQVKDSNAAESLMHEIARKQYKLSMVPNAKSKTTSEWYIDETDGDNALEILRTAASKYAYEPDDERYDSDGR